MHQKTLLFDFDGTIADNLKTLFTIVNDLSDEFGYKKILDSEIEKYRNKNLQQSFKEIGISYLKLPFFTKRVREELNKEMGNIKPVEGIKEVLLELKKKKFRLGIITTNTKENIKIFLEKNNLALFDFIYSGSSIFGKAKVLGKLLKKLNLKPEDTIYIGDETRDIEAAKKSKIKITSVGWGFNSQKILQKYSPDYFVREPKDLIDILDKKIGDG